jgi:DNA-binding NarL/FixJ family response regulator
VIRVMLCDDAVAFGFLFQQWLQDCDDLDFVGLADSGETAIALAARVSPDVIVVDHLLRDTTSDELAPQLRSVAPRAAILLISGMSPDTLALMGREAGADGQVSKAATAQEMCGAIRVAAELR